MLCEAAAPLRPHAMLCAARYLKLEGPAGIPVGQKCSSPVWVLPAFGCRVMWNRTSAFFSCAALLGVTSVRLPLPQTVGVTGERHGGERPAYTMWVESEVAATRDLMRLHMGCAAFKHRSAM